MIKSVWQKPDLWDKFFQTLFVEKDGDSYVITSFSDGDSEGDN